MWMDSNQKSNGQLSTFSWIEVRIQSEQITKKVKLARPKSNLQIKTELYYFRLFQNLGHNKASLQWKVI